MLTLTSPSTSQSCVKVLASELADLSIRSGPNIERCKSPIIDEQVDGHECDSCGSCEGFKAHEWRKTCQACKCPRENHQIYHEQLQNVKDRLGLKTDTKTSQIEPKKLGYAWTPPGILTSNKIQRYFDLLPPEKVPKLGTTGEKYRDKQLALQLPRQDLTLKYCKHIENDNRASYEDFIAVRNEIALDVGYIRDASESGKCAGCAETLNQGEMCVNAPKLSDEINFHPRCFKCSTCDELLVDLTYCVIEDKIFCERHYAEVLKPRCSSCDEVSPNVLIKYLNCGDDPSST